MNSQKTFNVGDLVKWKAAVVTAKPIGRVCNVEALGIIRKLIGQRTLELKVISTNKGCREYLNALKDLSAWERLPVSIKECEVIA